MSKVIVKTDHTWTETTQKGTVLIKQQAALDQGRDYPLPFNLTVKDPYPPGTYLIAGESFRVTPWGGIEIDPYNLKLVPVKG